MTPPDKRLNAYRPDLADARLRGIVAAQRFVEGRLMQVVAPLASVRLEPHGEAIQLSQALMGEMVKVFDERDGWAFVQLIRDSYVGCVAVSDLSADVQISTHWVSVASTFLYPAASLKAQPAVAVTLGAAVTVVETEGRFSKLPGGRFVYSNHLSPLAERPGDFVAVAEQFLHVPYYWGGKSVQGLDCSGLVQLSLEACGQACPRDSDMQEHDLGRHLRINDLDSLQRGDLVFWKGHVGIMRDSRTLLHANGHHMLTVAEPFTETAARIAATESPITSIKRF